MKKVYLLLATLFGLFLSTSAFAQLDELKQKTITIGGAITELEPDTWYFVYQGRGSGQGSGDYEYLEPGEVPGERSDIGGLMADQGIGNDLRKPSYEDVTPESSATRKAAYLVRFLPVSGKEGAYSLQFGTGNYLTAPAGTGNSKTITTTDNVYDAGEYNVYNIDVETNAAAFCINVYNMQERIDNNATGGTIVTWESGRRTEIGGNSTWSIHEVIWGEGDPLQEAEDELVELVAELANYIGDYFTTGTNPGDYTQEAVNAFNAAYDAALTPGATVEEIQAQIQALRDAYEAVLASKIPVTVADGYYRIRGAMTYINTINDEEVEVDKYMCSVTNTSTGVHYGYWTTPDFGDPMDNVQVLWKITKKEDGYDVVNVYNDTRFNNVTTSSYVTMSVDSENLMAFDPVVTDEDGVTIVNIRVATQAEGGYYYLHQGGHGKPEGGTQGTGVASYLVGWCNTYNDNPGASEWLLDAVADDEVQEILEAWAVVKNRNAWVTEYNNMVADAKEKIEIAKDIVTIIDEDNPLIADESQLSSPYTEPNEGSLEALLDGDASTFWHSAWSNGAVAGGTHYLQVEMTSDDVPNAAFKFTRRPVNDDHTIQWSVYGTNDTDAEKADCELLATVSTPYGSNTETLVSKPFALKGYKYIRFYSDAQVGSTYGTRGYFHMSEFQMYPAEISQSETCQYNVMGDVVKNLEKLIEDFAGIEDDDLDYNDNYQALKAAYDAFIAKFVDPAALRAAIAAAELKNDIVVIGTNPGYWSDNSSVTAMQQVVAAAKAYDAAGAYTPEKSDAQVKAVEDASAAVTAAAIGIQPGKWYNIRFSPLELFEEKNWDTVAGDEITSDGEVVDEALWDKVVTVAGLDGHEVEPLEEEDIVMGVNLFFDDKDDIDDPDLALFRFVAVGDSAYVLQNKATGLFVRTGATGATSLSVHPSLFNVRAIGYGQNLIAARSLTNGASLNYLHGQRSYNQLVTWNATANDSRSALFINYVEDVAADYVGTDFNVKVLPGAIKPMCYPVELTAKSGKMWGVASVEGTKITLVAMDKAVAGRPFFFIAGDTKNYDAEAEAELVGFTHGYDLVRAPQTNHALKGAFEATTIGAGAVIAEGNALVIGKRSNTGVAANEAYILGDEPFELEATLEVVFGDGADGIADAIRNISRTGAIYTIDGRLVGNGNLNQVQSLPKGAYILNGTKVIVK